MNLSNITTYQAGAAQASMHRLLQKVSDDILKPYGISKMQWMVIGTALDAGDTGIRISDLAETLGTTISYITTTINYLVARDILIRVSNKKDSRSKLVTVNPNYKNRCKEIESALRIGLRSYIYSHINQIDFETYMKVLYQLQQIGRQFAD